MDKISKEGRGWMRENYGECWKCKCYFHKSMLNMIAMQKEPLFFELSDAYNLEMHGKYSCVSCVMSIAADDLLNEDFVQARMKSVAEEFLPVAAVSQPTKQTSTKKKKKKKKRPKKSEDGAALATPPSSPHLNETIDDGKAKCLDRSASPTTVTSSLDKIDWVDYLQETGSIIALNEYMDSVLGVDDSLVSEDYDAVDLDDLPTNEVDAPLQT